MEDLLIRSRKYVDNRSQKIVWGAVAVLLAAYAILAVIGHKMEVRFHDSLKQHGLSQP